MPIEDEKTTGDGPVEQPPARVRISRRQFLMTVGAAGATTVLASTLLAPAQHGGSRTLAEVPPEPETPAHYGSITLPLDVNGQRREVRVEPRTTLLQALRYHLDPPLTGTKEVCDRGHCGACTVDLDGRTVYACMTLAVDAAGKKVTTIEGVAPSPDRLHPIQAAFVDHDAMQCGFCTPGFVMSVRACLAKNPHPTIEDVRHACAGNICRCGAYPHIFDAALDAAGRLNAKGA
ncbi:MAG: 2Fe-2S iron-sulfur cluster-binding protein [Capsulimonadaceae bacterium]